MSPGDGATLPSYGGTHGGVHYTRYTNTGVYQVPWVAHYLRWRAKYSVQEYSRPVRAIPLGFCFRVNMEWIIIRPGCPQIRSTIINYRLAYRLVNWLYVRQSG